MGQNISAFRGAYDFLSNFYPAPITYNGLVFKNNEAAFQAAKCPERRAEFCCLNPSEAKRLGRRVKLRDDWDQIKDKTVIAFGSCGLFASGHKKKGDTA